MRRIVSCVLLATLGTAQLGEAAPKPKPLALLSRPDLILAVQCSTVQFLKDANSVSHVPLASASGKINLKVVTTNTQKASLGFTLPVDVLEFGPTGEVTNTNSTSVERINEFTAKAGDADPPACKGATTIKAWDGRGKPLPSINARLFKASDVLAVGNSDPLTGPSSIVVAQDFSVERKLGATFTIDLKIFKLSAQPKEVDRKTSGGYTVTFKRTCSPKNSGGFQHDCKSAH